MKIVMYDTIDYDSLNKAIEDITDVIKRLANALGEILCEVAEKVGEILGEYIKKANKPKYKLVKSLIKPYKQPFLKVRYRARANL